MWQRPHPTPRKTTISLYFLVFVRERKKKEGEALEISRLNYERNGEQWPVHVGLARGYAANGDPKQALEHARKAAAQAPDALNRQSLEAMVAALEAGRPIAQ
jgi:Tfp pilus assembly protein PilF